MKQVKESQIVDQTCDKIVVNILTKGKQVLLRKSDLDLLCNLGEPEMILVPCGEVKKRLYNYTIHILDKKLSVTTL